MAGGQCSERTAVLPRESLREQPTPLLWITTTSVISDTPNETEPAVSPSRTLSQSFTTQSGERPRSTFCCSAGDPSCIVDEELRPPRMRIPGRDFAFQVPPPLGSPSLRESPELGASVPMTVPRTGGPELCGRDCSNPLAHRCLACRQKQMEDEFHQHVPGYLAAEHKSMELPCCALSSAVHTIVHVCDCMTPFELDRALAIENLRLERVRDAHAVVLTITKEHGMENVLSDPDLMLIVYKYDEMVRMYAMMGAKISFRRRQSYFRRVTSSLLPDSPVGRRKRDQHTSAREETQLEFPAMQELHQETATCSGLVDLNEQLRDAVRQRFSLRSLGTLTNIHVPPADASWHLALQEPNGLKIFFRRHASSTLLSFRVEGTVDANILNIISVLNEMDLYKDWIPYYSFPVKLGLREVKKLYQFGRVEQIDLLELDFPWPMNNRDCCVEIWAADDLDYTNRFFIRITSLEGGNGNPRLPVTVPMPPNKTLRLYCEGAVILIPLSPDKTFIELFWTLDPKVHLSDYLVNFFTKVFAKSSFQAFCKVCIDAYGGEHARRRQNCPLLYGFVERRLAEVQKTYEHRDGTIFSHDVLHTEDRRAVAPTSSKPASGISHPRDPTEHSMGVGKEYEGSSEALHAKKTRSGKIGFPFRRRRSSLMPGRPSFDGRLV